MARPKAQYGVFRLKAGVRPYEIDGTAIETHHSMDVCTTRLNMHRDAHMASGGNRYDIVMLPLGPKGEGLLGPGM